MARIFVGELRRQRLRNCLIIVYFFASVRCNRFPCDNRTEVAGPDVFYQRYSTNESYAKAMEICQSLGADLLTFRDVVNATAFESLGWRSWLSGKIQYWIHSYYSLALTYEHWAAGEPKNGYSDACVSVDVNASEPFLYASPCSEYKAVVCVTTDIMKCTSTGSVYKGICYLTPVPFELKPYFLAKYACEEIEAIPLVIFDADQLEWIGKQFVARAPLWTGYYYEPMPIDYYWSDGRIVSDLKWLPNEPDGSGDCLIYDGIAGGAADESCDDTHPFYCILQKPYASRCQPIEGSSPDECICVWSHKDKQSYSKALATCMSEGGTLLLYSSRDIYTKLSQLSPPPLDNDKWIGVSDGFANGVFRGTDGSAITWANWKDINEPKGDADFDCVQLRPDGTTFVEICSKVEEFICQEPPDSRYHPCDKTTGCLRTMDSYTISDFPKKSNTVAATSEISNVNNFYECWDSCLMNIAYPCFAASYNTETRICRLYDGRTGIWQDDPLSLGRERAWKEYPSDSYCFNTTNTLLTYDQGQNLCANPGWHLPIIKDSSMMQALKQLLQYTGGRGWIAAQDSADLPRVYKYPDGSYPYYTSFKTDDPAMSSTEAIKHCVIQNQAQWEPRQCTLPKIVICQKFKADVCREKSPDIENGYKIIDEYAGSVTYFCNPSFAFRKSGGTVMSFNCTCFDVNTTSLENCSAICPYPLLANSYVSATKESFIGDVIEITCNAGYKVANTSKLSVNSTCQLQQDNRYPSWSDIPACEAILCAELPNVTNGVYSYNTGFAVGDQATYKCMYGYRVNGSTSEAEAKLTCTLQADLITVRWSDEHPSCIAVTCEKPPLINNATVEVSDLKLGSVTTYRCKRGFHIKGSLEANATCNLTDSFHMYASWLDVPNCTAVTCPVPAALPNGIYTGNTDNNIGAEAFFQCDPGYVVFGSNPLTTNGSMTCELQQNGTTAVWSPQPMCKLATCTMPTPLPNGIYVNITGFEPGSEAILQCDNGYIILDSNPVTRNRSMTCQLQADGMTAVWSGQLTCTRVPCPYPPPITNGSVSTGFYQVGDTATYTCNDRFKINNTMDEANATCRLAEDGISSFWTGVPECTAEVALTSSSISSSDDVSTTTSTMTTADGFTTDGIGYIPEIVLLPTLPSGTLVRQCSLPNVIQYGRTHYPGTAVGSVATYYSLPGYSFKEGGSIRTSACLSSVKWSASIDNPQANQCPLLPLQRGTSGNYVRQRTGMVSVYCSRSSDKMKNGLNFVHTKCTATKEWSHQLSDCQEDRCGPFPYLTNADLIEFDNNILGIAIVRCHTSYRFSDGKKEKQYVCSDTGVWNIDDYCHMEVCPHLSNPANGIIDSSLALEGTTVTASCLPGYVFPDKVFHKRLTCGSDLRWNDTVPDCERVRCEPAKPVRHVVISGDVNSTDYNTTLTYRCDDGYRLPFGHQQIINRCEQTANWTYSNLSCELARCPPLPDIPLATSSTKLAENGTISVYICQPGYVFSNDKTELIVVCDGTDWNITDVNCKRVECATPILAHATFSPKSQYQYGDVVVFTCDEGYIYDKNITYEMQCLASGEWNINTPGCQPLDCGQPPDVSYSIHAVNNDHSFGQSITYRCIDDYWFRRNVLEVTITCTRNGTWTEIPTSCTVITCPPIPVWDDIDTNTTLRTVSTSASITCLTDENGDVYTFTTHCDKTGSWNPPIAICKAARSVPFQPTLTEAYSSKTIGFISISLIMAVGSVFLVSDVPLIIAQLKGLRRVVRPGDVYSGRF